MSKQSAKEKSLKAIVLSQLLIEANDDLKQTSLYRGKLKQHGRAFINQIALNLKQVPEINNADPQTANDVYNQIDEIVEKLAKMDIVKLIETNKIIKL